MKSWPVRDAKARFSEMFSTCVKDGPQLYNALRHGADYVDPGATYYEPRYRDWFIENLQRRAKAFGFVLKAEAHAGAHPGRVRDIERDLRTTAHACRVD